MLTFKPGTRLVSEIAFVCKVGVCVCVRVCVCVCVCMSAPEAINYIHVILNLYNQLDKFVTFRNITKLFMHGRGFCNEAHRDRNQSNKTMLVPERVALMALHE